MPDASAAGPGFSLRNHSSPARAWRSKRANAASFCVSDSRSGWFGFPRMSHSSASVHPARGEERRKGEGRGQEAEADWRFSRARGARDCAHLAVPRAPPRAAGRTRTPSRPSALALSAVARRATVSDAGSLSSSNLLFSPVALTAPAGLAFSLKSEDCGRTAREIFFHLSDWLSYDFSRSRASKPASASSRATQRQRPASGRSRRPRSRRKRLSTESVRESSASTRVWGPRRTRITR